MLLCAAPHPELLDLQLVLVQLVAEDAVLLVQLVDGAALLLDVALQLQPQNIGHLLSVVQLQPQGLTAALGLFQQGEMLEKSSLKFKAKLPDDGLYLNYT